LRIPAELLEGVTVQSIHWRPSCGNDELDVNVQHEHLVPEPATVLMLAGGSLLTLVRRRH
jgi:hypothetical protein